MSKIAHKLRYSFYRYKYNNAKLLNLNKPVDVSLELAASCNQRCGYCYHSDQKKLPFKTGVMPLNIAQLIIIDAASLGVNSLKFNYRGESTLNPHFKEITEFAKDHADRSTFIDRITNSNFKFNSSRDDIFEGLSNQTKVKVSFDSFVPEVMEKQRAGSNHSLAMKNIDLFYNHTLRIKSETKIVIQAVRTLLNKDEDIEYQVKKRWPEAMVSVRDMVGGRVDSDLSGLENRKRDLSERQSCIQAHARLIFDHDGNAQTCCPDVSSKINLGNIKERTIYQLWNSNKAKKIRQSLLDKSAFSFDPCKTCSSFESYKNYKAPKDS